MRPIKWLFKGNIEQITDTELRIRLRATQRNASAFFSGQSLCCRT